MQILFTRPIEERHCQYAKKLEIEIYTEKFIDTQIYTDTKAIADKLSKYDYQTWVVTSKNAGRFIAKLFENEQIALPRKIYAVGEKSAVPFCHLPVEIDTKAGQNAAAVSQCIISQYDGKGVIYLKGNISLNTIETKLEHAEIAFHSIECYKTVLLQKQVNTGNYDGFAFYSPSAATAFFGAGNKTEGKPIFAIGETTAAEIRTFTPDTIFTAEKPDTKELIDTIKRYIDEKHKQKLF